MSWQAGCIGQAVGELSILPEGANHARTRAPSVFMIAVAQSAVAADDDAAARKKLIGTWTGRVQDVRDGYKLVITADRITGTKDENVDLGQERSNWT